VLEGGLLAERSPRREGQSAPEGERQMDRLERTNAWQNAHKKKKKKVWSTERRDELIDFWLALCEVIIERRLIGEGWIR
jgi:hypothetical protein